MSDFKFSCCHCGQHLQCEISWSGRSLHCPACDGPLMVPQAQPAKVTAITPIGSAAANRKSLTTAQKWITASGLILVGAFTPFVVIFAGAMTLFLGPLAIVVAPVVVFLVSRITAAYCLERAGSRWFWLYAAVVALTFCAIIVPPFWPHEPRGGEGGATLEGALAAMGAGIGLLLVIGCAFLWSLGAVAAFSRK